MGTAVEDQQLGCLWQGPHLISVSLSGYINYLDVNNPGTPLRVIKVRESHTPLFAIHFLSVLLGSK